MSAADARATVSVNGGPEVPLDDAIAAIDRGLRRKLGAQADIEDADRLGKNPENEARDAKTAGIAADRLRSIVERIERLDEERKSIGGDIKDIFAEAKSAGFDVKAIRAVLKIRKQKPAEVEEQESLIDLYRRALGM